MPQTVSKGLEVPTTGSLPGTWGSAAINPDMAAIDGMFGGFVTLGLTNGNISLTVPSGFVATPGAGPTQSQNALIVFTGTITANITVTFPLPGYYEVQNLCTGNFYVRLGSSAPGNYVCAPPGEVIQIFNTGTNVFYVGLGRVGSYLDLATATIPSWITNCTVPPFLLADGSAFNGTTYPVLAAMLGGTVLPDSRGRGRYALDGGTNRVTNAISGIQGNTLLAAGGNESMQQHNHTTVVTDPGHAHAFVAGFATGQAPFSGGNGQCSNQASTTSSAVTGISVAVNNTGTGVSQNMPPIYVGGITLIRAA